MVTVQIICVSKLKEKYLTAACDEYAKRLKAFCRFSIKELPEARLSNNPSDAEINAALEQEGEKILEAAEGSICIPLCIEGDMLSSPQLAQNMNKIMVDGGSSISFIIGSSFGLSDKVKNSGKLRLSFSRMTFPHQLARVMLCEQIYRAFQIINNGKYHK